MCRQQGGGYSCLKAYSAGRAASFEQGSGDSLGLGNGETLAGSQDKLGCHVTTLAVNDRGPPGQNIMTVPSDNICCCSRGGQTAQLFRADRYPAVSCQPLHAGRRRFGHTVIPGTKTGQAGADEKYFIMYM